jgi:hypothetical protein
MLPIDCKIYIGFVPAEVLGAKVELVNQIWHVDLPINFEIMTEIAKKLKL